MNKMSKFEACLSDIGGIRGAMLTRDVLSSTVRYVPPLETIHFEPGDGNVQVIVGTATFNFAPICDVSGVKLGNPDDTSLTWSGGTCLTTEVAYYPMTSMTEDEFLATLGKGEYAVDYALGKIYYRKANDDDSDNATYYTRQVSLQVRTLCENRDAWEVNVYTIGTAGTGEMLPDLDIPNGMMLVVRAHPDNAGSVYLSHNKIGAESASNRITIAAGQGINLYLTNANLVWWNASQAAQKVEVYVEISA